ncbi:hypothetical protein Bbelb_160450 [Branchiostoma belcheri]|nr:hypothetical protein Bbelb_160450 [Branchiostoma belcheri]
MSVVEGLSNGGDTHAPDASLEETENSHCSTQTDKYGDDFIEPYLTAYHLGNLDAENPGEIASSQQEPGCHGASFLKVDGTDDDNIEPYLVSYHFEVTHCESARGPGQNEKEASLSEDHTEMSRRFEDSLRNETSKRRFCSIHEDTLQDEESTQTKEDHDTSISQDPTDHYYTYIGDHDYTYIDNTSIAGRQNVKEERGSDSVTHGLDPSQTTEPMKSTSQDEEHRATMLICWHRHIKAVATAIFVATLIVVGLLLVTGVLPPDVDKHSSGTTADSGATEIDEASSNSGSKNRMSTTTIQTEITRVKATKSFDVEGHPRKVTVSTSGKIAVMFRGRRVGVYDIEGIITVNFLTDIIKIEERHEKTIPIFPHDVSFGTLANNDVWIVGGNQLTHYVAQYDCGGRFKIGFAIPPISEPRRLALNRLSNRAIVTETDKHRGMVKVFMLNGMVERGFGWRQGLMYPTGITVDSEDSILVADSSTAYIYVYGDNGQFLFKFTGKGTNNGQLSLPLDICTDSSRHIIVADSGNRRIELFTSRGEFIRHIATDVELLSIAVGPDGQLVLTEASKKKEKENKLVKKGYQSVAMSVVAGPSNGEDTHAPDGSQDETENSHCSTQTDEYADGFIEPYLTAYHLGNLDTENPGDDAPFSTVEGTDEDEIEPYLVSYHFEVTDCEGTADMGRNGKEAMLSEDHTAKSRCLEVPLRKGPTAHCYTYIDDHDYTYIDNTSHSTQDVKEEPGSSSITSEGLESPQTIQPLKETSQQDDQRVTAIIVATLIIVGLLLVTRVLPLDLDKHAAAAIFVTFDLTGGPSIIKGEGYMKVTPIITAKSFHVNGNPRTVTVSTSGRIAVAFGGGRRIGIYDKTVRHRGMVKVFGLNGMLERSFGRRQGLMHPTGITVDSEDSILVADSSTAYIYVYGDNGQFLFKFAGKGTNNGQLSLPLDICTDSSRHIIVADSGNRWIELFTSRGEFIRHIVTDIDPLSIAVGPDGQLVLTEASKKTVTILTNY